MTMYQIDPVVAALPPTPAVRAALQACFFPDQPQEGKPPLQHPLRIDKLPLPDNDRDMLMMRLEGLMGHLVKLAEIVEQSNRDGGYIDPATRRAVHPAYLEIRLTRAVKDAQQLSIYLALNDAWRARDVRPLPKSAAIDMAAQAAVVEAPAV